MRRLFAFVAAVAVCLIGLGLESAPAGTSTSAWTLMNGPAQVPGQTFPTFVLPSVSCVDATCARAHSWPESRTHHIVPNAGRSEGSSPWPIGTRQAPPFLDLSCTTT